ncbi:queuosine precursor transporter [candidate division KSB1 bacterium]|nr:queuosine precursor transporter [candidate division KSB1 bacterium]
MKPELPRDEKLFILLIGVFVAGLTIASVLASKIIDLFGLYVPAGVLAYSITFIATDAISEIWGKAKANWVVFTGFLALLVVMLLVNLAIILPAAPFWKNQSEFGVVLRGTNRIILASFIAYLISQYHDVWAFHRWKKLTHGKHLWLRNNLSTIVSQFLDTTIFITIAFYGIQPVWQLIWGQFIVKIAIAVADTPVVYLLVVLIRKNMNR